MLRIQNFAIYYTLKKKREKEKKQKVLIAIDSNER